MLLSELRSCSLSQWGMTRSAAEMPHVFDKEHPMHNKLTALEHRTVCIMAQSWLAEAPPGAVVRPLVVPVMPPGSKQRQHLHSMLGALQYFMGDCSQEWMCSWQPQLLKACVLDRPVDALVLDPLHSLSQLYLDGCTHSWTAAACICG